MKKSLVLITIILVAVILLSCLLLFSLFQKIPEKKENNLPPISTEIKTEIPTEIQPKTDSTFRVSSPLSNQTISSPITISGEARGTWFFEGTFPIRLVDANGVFIASTIAQAQGSWTTDAFVPFKAELIFSSPSTSVGTLIFEKDNPSDLPENADERRIPITFQTQQRTVSLFFYRSEKDLDANGNIQCSDKGLEVVTRTIPMTVTPIQDVIRLVLQGELTEEERMRGLGTEYPLPGVTLKGTNLSNGILTLELTDPENKTSGGSCRVNILRLQIETTAKQFPEVTEVRFLPDSLFQP